MTNFKEFILEHENDDTARLILSKDKWPDIDMPLAANTIESRLRLRTKVPSWYSCPDLVYPNRISAEQCSSSETAELKAEIALRLVGGNAEKTMRIADLTGGLGVDTEAFRKAGFEVLYNEMDSALYNAAIHNLTALGHDGITFCNHELVPERDIDKAGHDGKEPSGGRSAGHDRAGAGQSGTPATAGMMLRDFCPDIIFLDPARRAADGKKVFLLEDCRPDILDLKDELLSCARFLMVKLSPMADIGMVCSRLGRSCREMHIIATKGECRELLAVLDRDRNGETTFCAWESGSPFIFTGCQKDEAVPSYMHDMSEIHEAGYLFEPGKALMKSGAFDLICSRFDLVKLAKSTHIYITPEEKSALLSRYGKVFRIKEILPLNNAGIRQAGNTWPHADVTARNIPMTSEALKSRLQKAGGPKRRKSAKSGDDQPLSPSPSSAQALSSTNAFSSPADARQDIHIFGLRCESGHSSENLLIITSRLHHFRFPESICLQ